MTPTRSEAKKQQNLDAAAEAVHEAMRHAGSAPLRNLEGEAGEAAKATVYRIGDALNAIIKAGGANPLRKIKPISAPDPLALSSLAAMDTEEARELLDLLERAQTLADVVDRQRGRALSPDAELLPGESYGTDIAESISEVALRLRRQIHGAGVGRE